MRAALVIVHTADGLTLVGRRRIDASFLGGFVVFPGGSIDANDREVARRVLGREDDGATDRIGALRELWEETGLILDGDRLRATPPELDSRDLEAVHRALGVPVTIDRLVEAAHWITPSFSPTRFDTTCYLLDVSSSDAPRVAQGELEALALQKPAELVAAWHRFESWLAPPTLLSLEAIASGTAGAIERLAQADGAAGEDVRYFSCTPGIRGVPLVTPTLPPAIHTNCYLIGTRRLIAVDPATPDDDERHVFLRELARLEAQGAVLESIVLTHHHGDHIGSAKWLSREKNVPIVAHPITRDLVGDRAPVTRLIGEGDRIDLSEPGSGSPLGGGPGSSLGDGFVLDVHFTPGHARGHIVLCDRRPGSRAMVVGDMVASIGTIIIDPPDGDMAEYLRQLARLRAMTPSVLFPAHGMPVIDGIERLDAYIAHRLRREEKVRAALALADTIEAMVPIAYADTPQFLWGLAERSCLAHVLKLVEDGSARKSGDRFIPS